MCESNVYLKDGENEVMIMESVDTIEPCENGLNLMDILGRQMFVLKTRLFNSAITLFVLKPAAAI